MSNSQLNQISEHVYWLAPDSRTDRPTLGVIAGSKATLIVDAGASPAHANQFLIELAKLNLSKPKCLVLTHWHWDHVFGTSAFDIPIYACAETNQILKEMIDLDWSDEALDKRVAEGSEIEFCRDYIKLEMPDRSKLKLKSADVTFTDQLEFDLGGLTCTVKHVGGNHSADSCIVHVPNDNILFLSDCLYEDIYHGPSHYTTKKLFPLIDEVLSYKADYYLFGHHEEPMSTVEISEYTGMLRAIGECVSQIGNDRQLILQKLAEQNVKIDEEAHETVDSFLAGLAS